MKCKIQAESKNIKVYCLSTTTKAEALVVVDSLGNFNVDTKLYDRLEFVVDGIVSPQVPCNNLLHEYLYNEEHHYVSILREDKSYGRVFYKEFKDYKNLKYIKDHTKGVYMYVPDSYEKSKKPYPVIWMFDGQNLFTKAKGKYKMGPYGSWRLDEATKSLEENKIQEAIIIGIDNSTKDRDRELNMSHKTFGPINRHMTGKFWYDIKAKRTFSNGHLDELLSFMFETVKPYVDRHFNLSDEAYIGGSSSGGIAAFYAGVTHSDYFKGIISFSPALFFFDKKDWKKFIDSHRDNLPKVYFYCGKMRNNEIIATMELEHRLYETMKPIIEYIDYPKNLIKEVYVEGAYHQEIFWSAYYLDAYSYIIKK